MTDPLGQSQVIPYVKGLQANGHQMYLMSYEKPERYQQYKHTVEGLLIDTGVIWIPFTYHKRFSILATLYDLIIGFFYLSFFIPRKKIKLIHCRSYISSVLGLLFKVLYGRKFIFDMRGFWADERIEGGIFKKNWLYYFFKWLEKKFLQKADATISLTQAAIREMATWPYVTPDILKKIHHITTCCDIESYNKTYELNMHRSFDPNNITFVYVGSIGPWHSFDEIKSFLTFTYSYLPQAKFKMIVQWGRELLEDFLKKSQWDSQRFEILTLTHKEIPQALVGIDIGFFFIPPVYAKISSSPTKMGEMLAAGIPSITGHSIGDVDQLINTNKIGAILTTFDNTHYQVAIDNVLQQLNSNASNTKQQCLWVANDYFSLAKGIEHYNNIYQAIQQS